MTDKPLSKRAQARARREAKEAEKTRKAERLAFLRQRATEMVAKLPNDWQEWGVVRTHGFLALRQIVADKVACHSIPLDRMEVYVDTLAHASRWSLDYCQYVQGLRADAADILPPEGMQMLEPA